MSGEKLTDAMLLDLVYAFEEGGPGGEVPAGVAVDRLLRRHMPPGHAFRSLFLLVDLRLVDWRSTEGRLYLAADSHYYQLALNRCEELGVKLPPRPGS